MNLKSMSNEGGKEKPKTKSPPIIENALDNVVSFSEGDKVMLKPSSPKYSNDLKRIAGLEFEVVRCFERDLGDGIVAEILYIKGDKAKNPYLAEHFKKVVE